MHNIQKQNLRATIELLQHARENDCSPKCYECIQQAIQCVIAVLCFEDLILSADEIKALFPEPKH